MNHWELFENNLSSFSSKCNLMYPAKFLNPFPRHSPGDDHHLRNILHIDLNPLNYTAALISYIMMYQHNNMQLLRHSWNSNFWTWNYSNFPIFQIISLVLRNCLKKLLSLFYPQFFGPFLEHFPWLLPQLSNVFPHWRQYNGFLVCSKLPT